MESRFDVGDIVETVPANFPNDWYVGKGLIVAIEDGQYNLYAFELTRISRKNFIEVQMPTGIYKFDIIEADECGYFQKIA